MHPHTNRRTDAYGGGRARSNSFVFETVQAVAHRIGAERVAIRIPPYCTFNAMAPRKEAVAHYADFAH